MFSYFCTWHLGRAVGAFSEHGLGWWPQHMARVLCCFSGGLSDWRWQWREVVGCNWSTVSDSTETRGACQRACCSTHAVYSLTQNGETCTRLMFTFVHLLYFNGIMLFWACIIVIPCFWTCKFHCVLWNILKYSANTMVYAFGNYNWWERSYSVTHKIIWFA